MVNINVSSSPKSVVAVSSIEQVEALKLSPSKVETAEKQWKCKASAKALRTTNPIRAIVDPIVANMQSGEERGDGKDLISLALGDPTVAGNLPPCQDAIDAVINAAKSKPHAAGYVNACGTLPARTAIAKFHSASGAPPVTADNVVIANGCSGALELAITALLDVGTILLVPQPGFPIYQVIAESHGASVVHYNLLPGKGWECDLDHLSYLLSIHGSKVRGILINNPSNPTGSVFSKSHLECLVNFAQTHQLPIIADEIYGDLTFGSHKFYPMAKVAASLGRTVPIITASGLGKQFLLPGWRVGWLVFHDNIHSSIEAIEAGTKRLAQVVLGACHLVQSVIPTMLSPANISVLEFKNQLCRTLQKQAYHLRDKLENCPGLKVLDPQGAFYTMVQLDCSNFDQTIQNDVDFANLLLLEENVFVLPGSAFGIENAFRAVFCASESVLDKAAQRIHCFCLKHAAEKA